MIEKIIIKINDENWNDEMVYKFDELHESIKMIVNEYFKDLNIEIEATL